MTWIPITNVNNDISEYMQCTATYATSVPITLSLGDINASPGSIPNISVLCSYNDVDNIVLDSMQSCDCVTFTYSNMNAQFTILIGSFSKTINPGTQLNTTTGEGVTITTPSSIAIQQVYFVSNYFNNFGNIDITHTMSISNTYNGSNRTITFSGNPMVWLLFQNNQFSEITNGISESVNDGETIYTYDINATLNFVYNSSTGTVTVELSGTELTENFVNSLTISKNVIT